MKSWMARQHQTSHKRKGNKVTKEQVLDKIGKMLDDVSDKDKFCESFGYRKEDYYVTALGYLIGSLKFLNEYGRSDY